MTEEGPDLAALAARARAGDDSAAEEIVSRFAGRLIAKAQRRLSPALRRKVDAEDVVQSVFRTFFRRQSAGQLELIGWGELWSLLVQITMRKCGREALKYSAKKRGMNRETFVDEQSMDSRQWFEWTSMEPTPAEAAELAELATQFVSDFHGNDRRILELLIQGLSPQEIAPEVSRTVRTVQRVQERARMWLEQRMNES